MKIKTCELTGAALDWAVAKCEGADTRNNALVWFLPYEADSVEPLQFICQADDEDHAKEQCENAYPDCTVDRVEHIGPHLYSSDWAQGGPIIDRMVREGLRLMGYKSLPTDPTSCQAQIGNIVTGGQTPLIAAMRVCVSYKLGDEVEVPDELL
ncbi:MAG: hypothetical protein ACD_85C00001G0005 [uncultured bacterium]|nr:MAG: hypothetical protein ACD_85C00001G0005 [uncultured bacterium]